MFFSLIYYFFIPKSERSDNALVLGVFSVVSLGFYALVGLSSWGFPKYFIVGLPAVAIFVGYVLSNIKIEKKSKIFIAFTFVLLLIYFTNVIYNPLIPEIDFICF